jgi:hypothetical protein
MTARLRASANSRAAQASEAETRTYIDIKLLRMA